MKFELWHYWIIGAFFFLLLEVFIPGFIMGSIGLGCLLASLAAYVGLPLWACILFFIAGFFVGITMLKPLLKRIEKNAEVKTNAEGLIGKKGKVSERIDNLFGTGRVHVDGDDWKAVSSNNQVIEPGTEVEITALNSIVVTVKPINNSENQVMPVPNEFSDRVIEPFSNKKTIVVSLGNKKEIIESDQVLCLYSNQKFTYLITKDGKQHLIDESLERLEERLGNHQFFRANRQFIITSEVVKEYKSFSDGKLEVHIKPMLNLPQSISVSRLKAHAFRKWLNKGI